MLIGYHMMVPPLDQLRKRFKFYRICKENPGRPLPSCSIAIRSKQVPMLHMLFSRAPLSEEGDIGPKHLLHEADQSTGVFREVRIDQVWVLEGEQNESPAMVVPEDLLTADLLIEPHLIEIWTGWSTTEK